MQRHHLKHSTTSQDAVCTQPAKAAHRDVIHVLWPQRRR
jgi:hypothetical protein